MEVVAVSAQSALDQLKAYSEPGAPNNAAPAAGKSAATAPEANGQAATGNLPDITGVRLGMILRDAFTVVQAAHPKDRLQTDPVNIPGIDKPVLSEFRYESGYKGQGITEERINVDLIPPPSRQVVWRVWHLLSQQKIYHANVVSSLREKYGKESATVPEVANDQQIREMWWFLDEQGRPAKPPQGNYAQAIGAVTYCKSKLERSSWMAPSNTALQLDDRDPRFELCSTAGIGIHADFGSGDIVTALQVEIFNYPAAIRSGKAELTFVDEVSKRQQQQQIDQSKQAKPKL